MLVKYNISAEDFKTLPQEDYPLLEPEFEKVVYSYSGGGIVVLYICDPIWGESNSTPIREGELTGVNGTVANQVIIGYNCFYSVTYDTGGSSNPGNPDYNPINPPSNPTNPNGNWSNNNGGTTNPGSPNVITTPLPEFETDLTPCEILKKTLGNGQPSVRDKLISLRPHTENDKEFGTSFSFDGNSDHYENLDVAPKTSDGTNNVSLPTGEYFYGGAHAHHKDGISVPSFRDILWLYQCREASITYNRKKAVLFTVTKNMISSSPATITYVMMVEDYSELEDFLQDMLGDFSPEIPPNDKIEMIMERDANDYLDDYATMEEKFLQKYSEAGFGLYKMNDSLTAAERISLDVTGNVSSTPCP